MKILIVGASGLVGWNLLSVARTLGHQVIGTAHQNALEGLIPFPLFQETSLRQLLEKERPDVLFYCAGWSWVDGCQAEPERARRENGDWPSQAAACADRVGCRFVYFSSSYVFNGKAGPYRESDVPRPLSV